MKQWMRSVGGLKASVFCSPCLVSNPRWCHAATTTTAAAALHNALQRVVQRIPQSVDHRVSSVQLLNLVREHAAAEETAALHLATVDDLKAAVASTPHSLSLMSRMMLLVHQGGPSLALQHHHRPQLLVVARPPQQRQVVVHSDSSTSAAAASSSTSGTAAATAVDRSRTVDNFSSSPSSQAPAPVDPRVRSLEAQIRRCLRRGHGGSTADGFMSLKQIAEMCDWTRDDYEFAMHFVLPGAIQSPSSLLKGLELKPKMSVRPKLRRRGCHVFVDADGFSKQDCQTLLSAVAVDPKLSTRSVVRHPSTGSHSLQDVVTTYDLPPYLVLEKQAKLLCNQEAPLLKDVVFACSDANFNIYAESVAPKLVKQLKYSVMYVCSPSKVVCLRHDGDEICL
ncbi:Hypothetical protein, putative [Bodo saltans]|uniref:Uncharacterized protein n=1 Tax=Bodo saltans TaxID=75058 RepID=A0A0S4JVG7_BODSA|nr:Hypothetical protein, putative [Bodo saltans]|eukprot:CUG93423.1 Hypothetical protein, putative [Bodo saltans]